MNKQEKDILNTLYHQSVNNQREISELSGHSLGVVNKSIKELMNEGYINELFTAEYPLQSLRLLQPCSLRTVCHSDGQQ